VRGATLLLLLACGLGGCGSRTGLPVGAGEVEPVDGGGPTMQGIDAGCPQNDNPWLLFDMRSGQGSGGASIYAMRADGSDGHTSNLPHAPSYFPSVSPHGTKLLYATPFTGTGGVDSALYAFDLVTHTEQLVITTTQLTYSALSQDEQTVAYVSAYSLHAAGFDGTNDRVLLQGPNGDGSGYGHPTFADSQTVVYETGGAFGAIGIDGAGNRLLVTQTATLLYPNVAFSPDHQRIVAGVFCDQTTPLALVVYDYASLPAPCTSGQVLTQVDESASFNGANDPSWSATGLIAYGSDDDVYVIDASGGTPRNMTQGLTGDSGIITAEEPVWAPGCALVP
jgi:hypothetical protein